MLVEAAVAVGLLAGHSVQDRALTLRRVGDAHATRNVLVVGSIHGNETAGRSVIRALRRARPAAGNAIWLLESANPDGVLAATRHNARGVDLNRNFPRRWRKGAKGTYYPGPKAASEPETRAVMRAVRRIRPDVTIWFHQHMNLVNLGQGADPKVVRAYARRVRMRARTLPDYRGTATSWQNHSFRGTSAFVVELPAGRLSATATRRHRTAIGALVAKRVAGASAAPARKPTIVQSPIPFGRARKRQMKAYARRHYRINSHLLKRPRTIVQHFTASNSYQSAFNTFASNARDSELGELPGVCTHFVIERNGRIHQLVEERFMCRHVIGLNHTAIGIEHVGTSDAQVMRTRRQLRASLRLTRWLQRRHRIATRRVIGHAESLSSPYHRERVAKLRKRTHGDFTARTMRRYRSKL